MISDQLSNNGHESVIVEAGFQCIPQVRTNLADVLGRFWVDVSIWRSAKASRREQTHFWRIFGRSLIEASRYVLRRPMKRTFAIWRAINAKHLSLWWQALNVDAKWLIVLEDDATLLPRTERVMADVVTHVVQETHQIFGSDEAVFLNLAGESGEDIVGHGPSDSAVVFRGLLESRLARVDTVCAYALNASAIKKLVTDATINPVRFFAVVDMMMNLFFSRSAFRVLHVVPTAFGHGSSAGDFDPWRR